MSFMKNSFIELAYFKILFSRAKCFGSICKKVQILPILNGSEMRLFVCY